MEIEEGEYIRTNVGKILKYDEKHDKALIDAFGKLIKVVKRSFDIIELIEVGDYVNGYEVINIYVPNDIWESIEIEVNDREVKHLLKEDIKTIVTKEQLESVAYNIEEEKDE